jgi:uncharacterized membrane protein YeaQ/YmgE (transglycosylase-associated protein family)
MQPLYAPQPRNWKAEVLAAVIGAVAMLVIVSLIFWARSR